MPTDTIEWTVKKSNRDGGTMDSAPDRFPRGQAVGLLPPAERSGRKWNSNPFDIDGGSDGRGEDDGVAFLLPYWLGRHHGFLLGEESGGTPDCFVYSITQWNTDLQSGG